jgi:SAM-dependent methyltransferase
MAGIAWNWAPAAARSLIDWRSASARSSRVVATDLNARHLAVRATAPTIEIRRHDAVKEALEERAFDLIHVRLVLEHLPERDLVLPKLVRALRSGGWWLVESVDYVAAVLVSELGAHDHERSQRIRVRQFEGAGIKFDLGRHLPRMQRTNGLVEVGNERSRLHDGGRLARRAVVPALDGTAPVPSGKAR